MGERAYRLLKHKIVSLELPPASLIDERALAAELGVGLTPVRQALRRLAMKSLVVIMPRRGTIVADLNPADLNKIFEMRLEMESLAAGLAAKRATGSQIERMARQLAQMEALRERSNQEAVRRQIMEVDHAMHMLLAEAAHNEFLEETLEWLYCHVLRLWNLHLHEIDDLSDALVEHREIAEAVRSRNSERAASTMRAHVHRFQRHFVQRLLEQ